MFPETTDPKLRPDKSPPHLPRRKIHRYKVKNLRIKDELKYLHMKKQQLNHRMYQLQISLANTWGSTWPYMQQTIEENLKR
jgi:hypothetical protein